jgi:hypothetical protein
LDETIWSLTSPRVKRISGFGNFRALPQKDFCNNISQKLPLECSISNFRLIPESELNLVIAPCPKSAFSD